MEQLFFIRIGGTAMGGVAAACQDLGDLVAGSEELIYEPMKTYLRDRGVEVIPTFSAEQLAAFRPDRVVVGNAVTRGNPDLEAAMEARLPLVSLPQIISEKLIGNRDSVVVTGTHGKTTTTSMIAWLLESAGRSPGFLIGGVPGNFEVSCRAGEAIFVVEGDEYDTAFFDKRSKFLWYRPDIFVVNNLEFDHADIFDSLESIEKSFALALRRLPKNGLLLHGPGDAVERVIERAQKDIGFELPTESFGFEPGCTWRAVDLKQLDSGATQFTVLHQDTSLGEFEMVMSGEHNVRNMLAAIAVAMRQNVAINDIQSGVQTFRPPKRRMEVIGEFRGATVIDDFAHHPTAIRGTLDAISAKYPHRPIWAVFEPRSNTTTRNIFQAELVECFERAHGVFFGALDRPERYSSSDRLNTDLLQQELQAVGKVTGSVTLEQGREKGWGQYARQWLEQYVGANDVIVLLSNGDLGGLRAMLMES